MKILAAIFVVLLVANLAYSKKDGKNDDGEIQRIVSDFLEEKASDLSLFNDIIEMIDQTKQNCPDFNFKINATLNVVQKCTEKIRIGPSTICTILIKDILPCTRPLRDQLVTCLPKESKDLPLLLEKITSTIITQACSSTLEEIFEYFNPCQFKKNISDFASCQEVKTIFKSNDNKLPSKSFLCSLLPKLRNCSNDMHNASCTNKITKNVFVKLHQAVEENTKEICA